MADGALEPVGAGPRSRDQITALARGLAVIRAFSGQDEQLTLADIAKLVQLPRATTRRCLLTLQALGYVEMKGRFFRLAPQVLTLAQAYLSSSLLPRLTAPFLERMSGELGESCSVSVLHDDQVIYVARSARKRLASLHRDVGARLPAYCTSMGRVLLAALPDSELDAVLKRVPRERLTRFTLVAPRELKEAIADVRQRDYSFVDQEMELDLRAIAVPLRNTTGRVVAALNVSTQASRTTKRQLIDGVLPLIRQAAAEIRPLLLG
ncbi:MAG TPA: IclR family transcriptional regulator C-terminal domain-containing protein [Alphaproteobacteria bacterium]